MTYTCGTTTSTLGEVFDCGRDDFFNPTPAAGSWLATHWNVYRSAHLGSCATELASTCGLSETAPDDVTAPVNTTPLASTAWRRASYSVLLSGTDIESGVAGVQWRVGGGSVRTSTRAGVSGDGVHTLETRVRDLSGNWSAWRSEAVRIDATAPRPSLACPSGASAAAACTVDADDATSGLAELRWRLGSGADVLVGRGDRVTIDASASKLVVTAVDAAGNVGVLQGTVTPGRTTNPVAPTLRLQRSTLRGRTLTLRGRLAGGPSPLGLTVTGTVQEGRRKAAVRFRLVARGQGVFDAVATLRRAPRKGARAQVALRHPVADLSLRRTVRLRRGTSAVR
jgi:hypothetical protein